MDKAATELAEALQQYQTSAYKATKRQDFWRLLCGLAETLSLLGKNGPEEFLHTADSEACLELLSQVVLRLSNLSDALELCILRREE